MTLSERNIFFKTGIVFCILCVLLAAGASYLIFPDYPSIMEGDSGRPTGIMQTITGWLLKSNYYAVYISIILSVIFSLTGMILLLYFYERTSTPEILYISLFIFSFSFEFFRFIIPMHLIYFYPVFYLLGSAKALLFTRYFGIFALFTAGVCAAGIEVQKTRNIILILTVAVLLIVMGIPVDALTWDTGLKITNGYISILRMMEAVVFITTAVSFLVAAKIRDSKDYIYVGIGVVLALSGRSILIETDNWAGPVLGILMLSFGTWLICSKLHKIHLWL